MGNPDSSKFSITPVVLSPVIRSPKVLPQSAQTPVVIVRHYTTVSPPTIREGAGDLPSPKTAEDLLEDSLEESKGFQDIESLRGSEDSKEFEEELEEKSRKRAVQEMFGFDDPDGGESSPETSKGIQNPMSSSNSSERQLKTLDSLGGTPGKEDSVTLEKLRKIHESLESDRSERSEASEMHKDAARHHVKIPERSGDLISLEESSRSPTRRVVPESRDSERGSVLASPPPSVRSIPERAPASERSIESS